MKGPARSRWMGDASGAFADGAVLFPLLLALAWQTGASAAMMLATTGAAYLLTAWLFRLPIPVQPLKSLSIVAIAAGATAAELQLAALLLGSIYLAIACMRQVGQLAARVPDVLVHGFQLGLGILLLITALRLLGAQPVDLLLVGLAAVVVLAVTRLTGLPVLGAIAVAGLLWGLWHAGLPLAPAAPATDAARAAVILLMVLPQIPLTLTNSVLGTERAARSYYGDAASRVTARRLLGSLGVGNLIVGLVGGLPYCHGSGGVTAHYRGGSRSWHSNAIIGGCLLLLALWLVLAGGGLPAYPPGLQALLLGLIGIYHLHLSAASWRHRDSRLILLCMGGAALAAQNMAAVLLAGLAAMALLWLWRRRYPVGMAPPAVPHSQEPGP